MTQTLYALEQVGLVILLIFIAMYVLWNIWQIIMWIRDEVAIWRIKR